MRTSTVGVVVGTFGCLTDWAQWIERARESVQQQTVPADRVIVVHAETLALARNGGAKAVETDFVIFLDADDELDPGYIEAMLAAAGEGDLLWPRVQYIRNGEVGAPQRLKVQQASLLEGNWMVIGSMVRRELFLQVGGFRELEFWEDWELWIRCWLAGARIVEVERAIYQAHTQLNGRNHVSQERAWPVYEHIRNQYRHIAVEKGYVHS